jgi:hypothetical protein
MTVSGFHWYLQCPNCGQTMRMRPQHDGIRVCENTYLDDKSNDIVTVGCGAVLQAEVTIIEEGDSR